LPKAERPRGQETAISFESPQRLIKQIAWPDPGLIKDGNLRKWNCQIS
jgi:hypothetical protein